MKQVAWIAILLFSFSMVSGTDGEEQRPFSSELEVPFRANVNGNPINAELYAAPEMADLDGDGLMDLLVGNRKNYHCRIYKNVGTKTEPTFKSAGWVMAGDAPAAVPKGSG